MDGRVDIRFDLLFNFSLCLILGKNVKILLIET